MKLTGQRLPHHPLLLAALSLLAFLVAAPALATSPPLGDLTCDASVQIPETLDCLESDAPFTTMPQEGPCELSVTLTNRCEGALVFYDAECMAFSEEGAQDESCLLAEIPAGAALEVPVTAGEDEEGNVIFGGNDSNTAWLSVDDGESIHGIGVTVEQSYPRDYNDSGADTPDCSTGGSSSPNRLLIILLLGWMGLRAMAAAPRSKPSAA